MHFPLPPDSDNSPSSVDRLSTYLFAFLPWIIVYEFFILIGAPDDAISTNLPFEDHLPVWEFTVVFYSFAFLFSLMVPFVIKTSKELRSFITDIWFTIVFVGIIYMAFPLVVKQREFVPHTYFGRLILFERSIDGESGALPSCHVIWAFLGAAYFSKSFKQYRWIWYFLALLISASCITTGAHSIPDVVAGFGTFIIVIYRRQIRNFVNRKLNLDYPGRQIV